MPSRMNTTSMSLGALALVASSCSEDTSATPQRIPTYHEDVAPILAAHCSSCHHDNGIGPFPLVDYEQARRHAGGIRSSTTARSMPPFVLDNSGSCNTYVEARWLTNAQIKTLGDWADAGAPEGDPSKAAIIQPPELPKLERVDFTLDMGTEYTPDQTLFDDYRCFIIDPGLAEDTFITGFDVRPGVTKMVHHLTLFAIDSEQGEKDAEALDAAEAGPGYSCIDDLRVEPTRWLVGWGPGSGALGFPEGTGLRMRAGRKTILQIHYNQENGLQPDRTRIDLMLAPKVQHEARVRRVANTDLFLPPKQQDVEQTAEMTVPRDVTLWGLWPHMHKLGTGMRVTAISEKQGETCLAHVDRWDFHWQGFVHYTKPITAARGDTMRITCNYNTLGRDTTTMWGQGTEDEMCIAFFFMTEN